MKRYNISYFDEHANDAEILSKALGFKNFSEFQRVILVQTLNKHENRKIIEQEKERRRNVERKEGDAEKG